MSEQAVLESDVSEHEAGKYLVFGLGDEEYAVGIMKVREIIGMMDVTAVPQMPSFIKGVINLRGRIIPVMDLREKFGMPATTATLETCIIVMATGHVDMGVIVDRVSEVMDIAASEIDETPDFGASVSVPFIEGIARTGERVTMLLDIAQALTGSELAAARSAAEASDTGRE